MRTPTEIINRSCVNKKSFSKENADKIIDKLANKNEIMYYYRCDLCCSYHLTRQDSCAKMIEVIGGDLHHN